MIKRIFTPALVALAALALAACNQAGKTSDGKKAAAKPPVATINGQPVSADAYALWVQSQLQKKPEEITPDQHKQTIDAIVNLYVTAAEAEKQNIAAEPEVAARIELERKNTLANALFSKYVKDKTPTDVELHAEYDKQIASMPKQEYHARHILVKEEAQAKDVIVQLGKGAKFEELAKKLSVDGSKAQGGDLPWFAPGQMVKPFSDAVEKLNRGEYTKEPVKSDFGWHVIRLEDTRPLTPPAFDTVKDRLGPMVQQRVVREYIENLRKTAKIELTP
jgi:peptidyl-prolyl cis-trans isomerase C